jgi:hypothetical protein
MILLQLLRLVRPLGLELHSSGNIFVTEWLNNLIRRITPVGTVTTIAGKAANAGNADGIGSAATFSLPSGIVFDSASDLFVANWDGYQIRKLSSCVYSSNSTCISSGVLTINRTLSLGDPMICTGFRVKRLAVLSLPTGVHTHHAVLWERLVEHVLDKCMYNRIIRNCSMLLHFELDYCLECYV